MTSTAEKAARLQALHAAPELLLVVNVWDAITEQAFYHWKNGQAQGPADLPEAAAELPSRYRMPYAVRDAA